MPESVEDQVRNNARRLVDDAALLLDHERFASSFALAVLALEEVGKLVLQHRWAGDPELQRDHRKFGYHKVKQAVVGAMYLARTATDALALAMKEKSLGAIQINSESVLWNTSIPLTAEEFVREVESNHARLPEVMDFVAKAMEASEGRRFLMHASIGAIDKAKQCALYVDEEFAGRDLTPFDFFHADAENMIRHARDAIELSDTEMLTRVAKPIYQSILHRNTT